MLPDLGKYSFAVLGSYAASALLIAGVIAVSFWQRSRVKRALAEVEARQGKQNG
jgi:heme exporter protein D